MATSREDFGELRLMVRARMERADALQLARDAADRDAAECHERVLAAQGRMILDQLQTLELSGTLGFLGEAFVEADHG